jgi:hypothetical protein
MLVLMIHDAYSQLVPNLGGQRSGISAFQFLKIGSDPRGAAMGEAYIAVVNDVTALYWNPAALVLAADKGLVISSMDDRSVEDEIVLSNGQAVASHTEWLVDLKHEFFGMSYNLSGSDAVGISMISLHTDDMKVTTEVQPLGDGTYFQYSDLAIGVTYSRRMTDQFTFGATVKYVRETIDVLRMEGFLLDLGTFYFMGIGSARFAVAVTNFGSNVKPVGSVTRYNGIVVKEFQAFSPPTIFKLGIAFEPYQSEDQRITTSVQLNHPNDNAENVRIGCEYEYGGFLFFRGGVKRTIGETFLGRSISTAEDYGFGGGVRIPLAVTAISADYSYSNFNDLGNVHRISIGLTY